MLVFCMQFKFGIAQTSAVYKLGQSVDNFGMFDMNSVRYATKNIKTKKIIVLAFISNECKYAENINEQLNTIYDQYSNDVEIWAVNSFNPNLNPNEGEDMMNVFVKEKGLKLPYLVDLGKSIASRFSVQQVPSAVILVKEADEMKYVYNGAIIETLNGKPYYILEQNINNILNGKKVISSKSRTKSCQIQ